MSSGTGTRYVEVPAARLQELLDKVKKGLEGKGARYIEGQQGRERVVDLVPPHGRCMVRLYTSLAVGEAVVRDCGEDAVRIQVVVQWPRPGEVRVLEEPKKMLRTAPKKAEDRVGAFLERLRLALREAYGLAFDNPPCPMCGAAMARRQQKGTSREFYGCIRYPNCKGLRNIEQKKEAGQ